MAFHRTFAAGLAVVAGCALAPAACAQDIEPRTYSNAPIGVNFLVAGYAYTKGALQFDSALEITDADLRSSNEVLAFAHAFDLGGSAATVDVIVPYTALSGTALYQGDPIAREANGLAAPSMRLCWNFYGAPAMGLAEFRRWKQDVVVGASIKVWAPWGQYDPARIVNIGSNRWIIKPEVGVSKTNGPWTLEAAAAVTYYTTNDEFYGGIRREQDPLYSVQGHVIHSFANGSWLSVDATYFTGGRTTLNGVLKADLQQNWRAGATYAMPIDRKNSIKLYASRGLSDRTGNSFDLVGIAWQHRWGGGL